MFSRSRRVVVSVLLVAIAFFAQTQSSLADYYDGETALVPCGAKGDLCTLCHVVLLGQNIFVFLLKISFIIALTMAMIAGILYIISGGASKLIGYAGELLKYTLLGFAFCLLCYVAVNTIASALGYTGQGGSWARPQIDCDSYPTGGSTPPGGTPPGTTPPQASSSPTPSGSPSPSPSASPSSSPSPSGSPTPTPSPTPTASPSLSPSPSPSPSPTLRVSPDPIEFTKDGQTEQAIVTYDDGKGSVTRIHLFNLAQAAISEVTGESKFKIADQTIASVSSGGVVKNERKQAEGIEVKSTTLTVQYKDQTKDASVIVHSETCPATGVINGELVSYGSSSDKKDILAVASLFKYYSLRGIPEAKAAESCTDSDGGKIYNIKGTTRDPWGVSSDRCHDTTRGEVGMCTRTNQNCRLVEFFCEERTLPGGARIIERKSEFHSCGSEDCSNGACSGSSSPSPSPSGPPGSPTPAPTSSPSSSPNPSSPGADDWQITNPEPNEFDLESLKKNGASIAKICFIKPPDAQSRAKNMYYFPHTSDYPNLRKIIKTTFKPCGSCKGPTVFMDVKHYEGMVQGDYDIYIEDDKGQFHRFPNAFKVKGEEIKDCTPLSDKSLKAYDNRIPLVFVADSDYGTDIEPFRKLTNGNVIPSVTPADTSNYTVWRSEKIGTNACPTDSRMLVAKVFKTKDSDTTCKTGAYGYSNGIPASSIAICAAAFGSENIGETVSHEMGHAHGALQDEYFPHSLSPFPGNRNCYQGAAQQACGYYQSIVSNYACANIKEGCNYVATGWVRSINNGLMNTRPRTLDFGVIGKELYQQRIKTINPQK